ncbi:succinate dehydrogenase, hydrophobic membrane anchor protein [Magnetospirillum molischianum]|uniref:Succinate dehydrogenase hydrophobic membrane anchor subunit n=1 Tax=Magnetospirillum molischianum DSM 120 TaxID=1150626 RepID=H8FUA5_MAGML|nr:succinate dehydrogenase, hydrophobic membrane anchor protein [Magnetospirillum molischianum]CCG41943.1 Succinate dehydrogenase, hydrophobic anchor subunit [Magnetospirillum molischianum DSM 120]
MGSDVKLRSALGRARGLGSAREGVGHFYAQRATAIGMIPLSLWFVVSVIGLTHADYGTLRDWVGQPLNATLLSLTVLTAMYHAQLGVEVVIADYVHGETLKFTLLTASTMAAFLLGAAMVVSILKVAVGV